MLISASFLNAATVDVASSGRDVPTATIVIPIINSLIPIALAMGTAALTKISAPAIRTASPAAMRIKSFAILSFFCKNSLYSSLTL